MIATGPICCICGMEPRYCICDGHLLIDDPLNREPSPEQKQATIEWYKSITPYRTIEPTDEEFRAGFTAGGFGAGAVSICHKCGAQNITTMCPDCPADARNDRIWDAVVAVVRGCCLALAIGIGAAHAQTTPPTQAQAQAPAAPADPTVEQIDADLRALVSSINARLAAINDDVTALKERAKQQHTQPASAKAESKQ